MGCKLTKEEAELGEIDIPVNTGKSEFVGGFQVLHDWEGLACTAPFDAASIIEREAVRILERTWQHFQMRKRCRTICSHLRVVLREEAAASLLARAWRRRAIRRKLQSLLAILEFLNAKEKQKKRRRLRKQRREQRYINDSDEESSGNGTSSGSHSGENSPRMLRRKARMAGLHKRFTNFGIDETGRFSREKNTRFQLALSTNPLAGAIGPPCHMKTISSSNSLAAQSLNLH
eukprot:gb/GEZN01011778.1/.p1 GENE.gb/GEZN01011778.1/~~gb/GEZN01011778.1/.p1  ORF type:complete len:232 (+),score=31.22 gb/GEZN01011778.1/:128-823(+)